MDGHNQAEEQWDCEQGRREMDRAAPRVPDRAALDERLQWQAQERAERLQPLRRPLRELAQRLSLLHPDWDMAEQICLQYVSLEVAACLEAEPVIVESRGAEEWEWRGRGAVAVTMADRAGWSVIGTPEIIVEKIIVADWAQEMVLVKETGLMDMIVANVEREVLAQKLLVPS